MPLLICPNDNNQMLKVSRNDVELDICPTCSGVWLDRGELNKLLAAEKEHNARAHDAQQRFQEDVRSFERDSEAWRRSREHSDKRYRDESEYDDRRREGISTRVVDASVCSIFSISDV